MVWPILIHDKKIVNKLYETVLMNIANILKKIAKIDEDDISPLLTSRNEYVITQTLGGQCPYGIPSTIYQIWYEQQMRSCN